MHTPRATVYAVLTFEMEVLFGVCEFMVNVRHNLAIFVFIEDV